MGPERTRSGAAQLIEAQRAVAVLEDVLESMSDGFFAYDAEWRCVRMNGTGRAMLEEARLPPAAILGRNIWEAIPGLAGSEFQQHLLRCARERVPVRFEAPGPRTGRWVESAAVPIAGGVAVFSRDVTERHRAELREQLLVSAGALLSQSLELGATLRSAARAAARDFCDACIVTGSAPDERGDERRLQVVETAPGNGAADILRVLHESFPLPPHAELGQQHVMRTGRSQLLQAESFDPAALAAMARDEVHLDLLRRADLHSVIIVPLIARARTFGAVSFIRHSGSARGAFDADDLRTAEELGRRAALAMDNARLFAAERGARARAERLQDLATALSAATTFSDVAEAILTEGMALVGATGGRVVRPPLPGEDVLHIMNARGWAEMDDDPLAPIPLDAAVPTSDAFNSGKIVWVRQHEMRQRYPDLADLAERGGHRTWIAVPFRHEGRTIGAVGLALPEDRAESEDMLALLRTMAHQCAQAIERIRLYEEAQRARTEAERERADLTAVLEVTPIGIGIARDPQCLDIRANPALAAHLGIQPDENASKSAPHADALPFRVYENGRELTPHELPMQRAARDGSTVSDLALDIVHADGRRVHLLEYAAPLLDDDGRPRGAVGAFVDITERMRLLEAEREARREAEAARLEAEAANQAKSDFLAMMSHELRTPLNAIAGYVELLEMEIRGPINEQQRADLQRIRMAQRTLLRRIDDVLSFARLEAGQVEFERAHVSVASLIDEVEPLIAPQVDVGRIRYECEPCDPSLHVLADPAKASQVLLNLVANAVKFTPAGGTVSIAAEPAPDGRIVIRVSDTGVGIPAEKLANIFDPFMQVDTRLTREHGGTGLGLAISRDLVRGMGGELTVESTVGTGSTFRLILPAAPAP